MSGRLKPNNRCLFVSLAVNSTYPSPVRLCTENAPAFPHISVAVLVRLFPFTDTPTAFVQTIGCALAGGVGDGLGKGDTVGLGDGLGDGDGVPPVAITALVIVAPAL